MHKQREHMKCFSSAKSERLLRAHCKNASRMQRFVAHKEMIEQDRVRSLCDINRELRDTRMLLSEIKAISGYCHEACPNYLLPGSDFTAFLNNSRHTLCNTVKLDRSINNMPDLVSKFDRLAPFNEPWCESGVMDSGQPSDAGKDPLRKGNTSGKRRYTISVEGYEITSEISARQHFTYLKKCTLLTKDTSAIGEVPVHGSGKELNQKELLPHRFPSLPFLTPHARWGHGHSSHANAPGSRSYFGNERVRQSEPVKESLSSECRRMCCKSAGRIWDSGFGGHLPWMLTGLEAPCAVYGTGYSAPFRAVMSKATVQRSLKQLVLGYNQPSSRSLLRDRQEALRARVSAFVQELK